MTIDILKFRSNAQSKGICDEYLSQWDNCMSKKDLFDLACRIEPATYLVKSISEGWGVTPMYLKDNFERFINGQYKAKFMKKGNEGSFYTSQLWCCSSHESIVMDTTLCVLIDCNVDVFVRDYDLCRILTDATSIVRLHLGKGSKVLVETHSDNISVMENEDSHNVRINRLNGK